jgi:hypothetical protein
MISLNAPLLPNTTAHDHQGLVALLALIADPAAAEKRLAALAEATAAHEEKRKAAEGERKAAEEAKAKADTLFAEAEAKAKAAVEHTAVLDQRHAAQANELEQAHRVRSSDLDKYLRNVQQREAQVAEREKVVGQREIETAQAKTAQEAEFTKRRTDFETSATAAAAQMDQRHKELVAREVDIAARHERANKLVAEAEQLRTMMEQKRAALKDALSIA